MFLFVFYINVFNVFYNNIKRACVTTLNNNKSWSKITLSNATHNGIYRHPVSLIEALNAASRRLHKPFQYGLIVLKIVRVIPEFKRGV